MIEVRDLIKHFGAVRAVDGVSFTVARGSIFGLIGPNGAGKTTCLNILSTLLKPTSGTVTIDGLHTDEHVRETRRKLGYMPDFFGTYRHLSTWEYLDFFGGACGVPSERRSRRIEAVLELTHLQDKRDELVDNLSRGMKQRLCLAKALLHEPLVLILDEPASGLDPRGQMEIRETLKSVIAAGTTVVISSHILSELSHFCTHIGIMEQGKLLRFGPLDEILRAVRPRRTWRVALAGDPAAALSALQGLPLVLDVKAAAGELLVSLDEALLAQKGLPVDTIPTEVLQALLARGVRIVSFAEDRANLEDAFLAFTKGLLA